MGYEEKESWIFLLVLVVAFGCYSAWLIVQVLSIPLTSISYIVPMLLAIGGVIISTIIGNILITITNMRDTNKTDQRDREIRRYGDYSGQFLVNIGGLAAIIMCMFEVGHFWIAHTIYFAFVGAAFITSVVKILAYRRGFYPC
jgi:hypothetical protein